jgi:ribonucleoside-diphosphate reductase beta chain
VRNEEPDLFDAELTRDIATMLDEAVECELQFAEDVLALGVAGLSIADMRQYLEFIADQRLRLGPLDGSSRSSSRRSASTRCSSA